MKNKGNFINTYELEKYYTLPLTFKTRFGTTTAISDIGNYYGEYCVVGNSNGVKGDVVTYGAVSSFTSSNFDPSFFKSQIANTSVFIITIGL